MHTRCVRGRCGSTQPRSSADGGVVTKTSAKPRNASLQPQASRRSRQTRNMLTLQNLGGRVASVATGTWSEAMAAMRRPRPSCRRLSSRRPTDTATIRPTIGRVVHENLVINGPTANSLLHRNSSSGIDRQAPDSKRNLQHPSFTSPEPSRGRYAAQPLKGAAGAMWECGQQCDSRVYLAGPTDAISAAGVSA